MFNGDHHVLYWADASSEIAFVVPSNRPGRGPPFGKTATTTGMPGDDASLDNPSPSSTHGSCENANSLTLDLASFHGHNRSMAAATTFPTGAGAGAGGGSSAAAAPPESAKRRFQRQMSTAQQAEVKMIIVWLERMEDSADIPLDHLLAETMTGTEVGGFAPSQKDAFAVFIQPMKSGLMMIRMQGQTAK